MGETQRDLIGSRLFGALNVSSARPVFVSAAQPGPGIQSFTKGHSNTSSPHNLFRVKLQFTNSAGPHLMWPHYTS